MSWPCITDRFPWQCHSHHSREEVVPWLEQHVGEFDQDWYLVVGSDIVNGLLGEPPRDEYLFVREQDAVFFRLRWS